MRQAIVDNLTLSAVQRLLGQVITKFQDDSEEDIQGERGEKISEDILDFDNLLIAILFSDEVAYIRGFMPQDKDATRFGEYFPRFRPLTIGPVAYRTIIKDINNEFALKYDKDIKETPAFFKFEFMKPHIQLPAINRIEYGALVYTTVAANLGADLMLCNSRSNFQQRFLNDFTKEMKVKGFSKPVIIKRELPMFIAWFANKYKDPSKFINEAFALKEKPEFVEIRKILEELRKACENNSLKSVFQRKVQTENLLRKIDALKSKYSVETGSGKATRVMPWVFNVKPINQGLIPAPAMNYHPGKKKEIEIIKEEMFKVNPRQEHLIYLGNLDEDKIQVEKLGSLYHTITSNLVVAGSEEAKIFDEAMKIKTFRANKKEGKEIYESLKMQDYTDIQDVIFHVDVNLSPETEEFIENLMKEE